MRPIKNIEKFVRLRKPNVKTSRQMDKQTLNDSFAAMEEAIRPKSTDYKLSTLRLIFRSRTLRLAAAAVIITAIGVFVARMGPEQQLERPKISETVKSPAEMLTVASLNAAYRRGGIEEVEKQCERAIEVLGPRPAKITVKKLLSEFNGT